MHTCCVRVRARGRKALCLSVSQRLAIVISTGAPLPRRFYPRLRPRGVSRLTLLEVLVLLDSFMSTAACGPKEASGQRGRSQNGCSLRDGSAFSAESSRRARRAAYAPAHRVWSVVIFLTVPAHATRLAVAAVSVPTRDGDCRSIALRALSLGGRRRALRGAR